MLVSRLVTRLITFRTVAAFAPPSSTFSNLQNKALATKTLGDFTQFAKQNSKEMTADVLASVSRHISQLINSRERMVFEEARDLLKIIEGVDVSSLSLRNVNNILSVLRTFKSRGYNSSSFNSFKTLLCSRIVSLVKEREQTEQDIGDLINSYAELTFFHVKETKIIAERLSKLLDAASQQGKSGLTDSQMSFLLWGLSLRHDLNQMESRIRSHVIREVGNQLGSFKLTDLVKIAVNINKNDLFDLQNSEFNILKQISDRIYTSVHQLEERSIYEIIRSENVGKMPGIYRVYEEISRNLFNEIEAGGETELGPDPIFRIVTYLSSKIQLSRVLEADRKKFFAFLDRYVDFCVKEQPRNKLLGFKIKELIANDFFSGKDKERITKILQSPGTKLNTFILYEMAIRDYDISLFSKEIFSYTIENLNDESLVRMGIVAAKLVTFKVPEAKAYFDSIEAKLGDKMDTPEKFVDFYKRLMRMEFKLQNFFDAFSGLVERLPNPLETQIDVPEYRLSYLKLINDGKRQRDYLAFFNKHEAAITADDLSELIFHHVRNDPRQLEYKRQLLQLVNKRVYELIDGNSKRGVEALIELLNKYNRFVLGGNLDVNSENVIFRIMHCLIGKLDILNELNLNYYFNSAIEKYVTRTHKNYNVESNYRQLIKHLVAHLNKFATNPRNYFVTVIVKEALRLGELTKNSLEKIEIQKLSLKFFDRSRAQYIKDPTFAPTIEKVTQGALQVMFSNHNLENMLVESQKQIIQTIQKINPKAVCGYLVNYCHNKSPASKRILAEMLNIVVSKVDNFERVDITGILQNAIDKNLYHFSQYKKITENLIEQLKGRLDNWSIDIHLNLIKFIISQPGLNPKEYYTELVQFAEKQRDISEGQYEQVLLRLANTNYKFREIDLQYVGKIIKKTPHSGLFFFFMVEPSLSPEVRSTVVKHFVEKMNDLGTKKEQTMSRIQYQYLKKAYPEETANFNFEEKSLNNQYLLSKPKNTDIINTIVKLAGGKSEDLTVLGAENYLLKINKYVFAFLPSKRVGSINEQDFIKRVINALTGEQLNVVYLFLGVNHSSTLEFINRQCPELFDQTEYQKDLAELKSNVRRKAQPVAAEE